MLAVLPLAWAMVQMPRDAPWRDLAYNLHKSLGLTALLLVAARLVWRTTHPAPALSPGLARWERASAVASHWLLYLVLVGMPVSGFLLSAGGGKPVTYFGLFTVPAPPRNAEIRAVAAWVHVATGQWLLYALILLHVAATAWHVVVRRDGVLDRMLPAQHEASEN
jgi:cytochrome b561